MNLLDLCPEHVPKLTSSPIATTTPSFAGLSRKKIVSNIKHFFRKFRRSLRRFILSAQAWKHFCNIKQILQKLSLKYTKKHLIRAGTETMIYGIIVWSFQACGQLFIIYCRIKLIIRCWACTIPRWRRCILERSRASTASRICVWIRLASKCCTLSN